MGRYLYIVVISFFLAACENQIDHIKQYNSALSKWNDMKIVSYSMSYTTYCYCPENGLSIELLIENKKVTRADNLAGNNVDISKAFSVEKLYMIVDMALKDKNYKIIDVLYDNKYGFPRTIEINNSAKTDTGIKILVTDFKAIN